MELENWKRVAEGYYGGSGYVGLFVEKNSGRLKVTASPLGVGGYQIFPQERGVEALQLYEKWSHKVSVFYSQVAA